MGTFGGGPYDNDAALDFVSELIQKNKIALLRKALTTAIRAKPRMLEDWPAQEAVAAAAIVASLRGHSPTRPSPELKEWLATTSITVDQSLTDAGIKALQRVVADSELAGLITEGNGFKRWSMQLERMIRGLQKTEIPIKKKQSAVLPSDQLKAVATLKKQGFDFAGPAGQPYFCAGEGKQLPDYAANCFAAIPTLNEVRAAYRISRTGWTHLTGLPKLRRLDISNAKGVEAAADVFQRMERLRELVACSSDFGDAAFASICKARRLKSIDLSGTQITDRCAQELTGLPELEHLDLSRTRIGDASVTAIARFTNLKSLNLRETKVTSQGCKMLRSLRRLEGLGLGGSKVDDQSAQWIAQMPSLKRLFLEETNVGDAACRSLAKSKSITAIDLRKTAVTSEGCKYLARIESLRELDLDDTSLDATAGKYLAKCESLRVLGIKKTAVTFPELAELAHLENLIELAVDGGELRIDDCQLMLSFSKNVRFDLGDVEISNECKSFLTKNKYRVYGEYVEANSRRVGIKIFGWN